MIYVVIAFLWLSICLYIILGGADFGAGIVEFFASKRTKRKTNTIMYESIAPIWEANHMWLIIAIVVMFVGFPQIYATLSTYLHIPLVLMLVGIIARGTAFTFRHYDAVHDDWQLVYRKIFYYASISTPFFLGIIAAATVSATINPDAKTFLDLYIFSWLTYFGVSVGIFTTCICAYLASVFAIGETKNEDDALLMVKKTKISMLYIVISGILVFIAAQMSRIPLLEWVFSKPIGIIALVLATISLGLTFVSISKKKYYIIRVFAGFQIIMILVAATYQHYPNILLLSNGNHLSLLENTAPESAISALAWALMIGSVFILPFLFYLIYSFSKLKK